MTSKISSGDKITIKEEKYPHILKFNKTLIVGHAFSEHKVVTELLQTIGMQIAKPSQQRSLKAADISNILSHAYSSSKRYTEQISVDKVWDGLALDLFMSNRSENWWGWFDSEALPYLNFWKSLDSRLGFIFIYDTPINFLERFIAKNVSVNKEELSIAIDEWLEYNEALLKFYYRNAERSLLVNAQQVKLQTTEYLQQVTKQIGLVDLKADKSEILSLQEKFQVKESVNPLFSYLVRDILSDYSDLINLYEELQSVANLPYDDFLLDTQFDALSALSVLQQEKQEYFTTQEKLHSSLEKNKVLEEEITSLQAKQKELIEKEKSKTSENELLLTQLMSVQEELEKYYLESQKNTKEIETIRKSLQEKQKENKSLAKESLAIRQSKDEEIKQLKNNIQEKTKESEELKKKLNDAQAKQKELIEKEKSKTSENELLLTQLMSVQEELEKYYLENKRLKEKQKESIRYYGAAERVKQQLSYRLGAKMIEESKSFGGVLLLPFSLRTVYKEHKKDMQERKGKKLPPIESYADAYEAEKVKKHLSYRLGQAMIKSMKSPLGIFILPFALKKAHREFKEERANA